jgi:hypothetical protein
MGDNAADQRNRPAVVQIMLAGQRQANLPQQLVLQPWLKSLSVMVLNGPKNRLPVVETIASTRRFSQTGLDALL